MMLEPIRFYSFVEDEATKAVALRIVAYVGEQTGLNLFFEQGHPVVAHGFGGVKVKAQKFFKAASAGVRSVFLTDLDARKSPNEVGQSWFEVQCLSLLPPNFIFRVCVREVEAWIMADRQAFADFLGISVTLLPQDMDSLDNPKQFLLNLIQTKCRKRCYRDMLPLQGQCIGINYNPMLTKFIRGNWSPDRASSFAPSLRRSLSRIIETVRSYADTQQSRNIP